MREFTSKMLQTKIGGQTLREPAQSKCTWTFHKSHVAREFSGTMRGHTIVTHTLCKPAQSKCTRTYHKSQFMREFTGKMLQTKIAGQTLREPAQSECIWTFDRSQTLCENSQEKCQGPRWDPHFVQACTVEMHLDISQEPVYARIHE